MWLVTVPFAYAFEYFLTQLWNIITATFQLKIATASICLKICETFRSLYVANRSVWRIESNWFHFEVEKECDLNQKKWESFLLAVEMIWRHLTCLWQKNNWISDWQIYDSNEVKTPPLEKSNWIIRRFLPIFIHF